MHAALVAHSKNTLESLILRSSEPYRHLIGNFFAAFEILKKLEPYHSYLVRRRGPQRTRLADALPSSLEELCLHDPAYKKSLHLDPYWPGQEILEDKDTHLPYLEVIVFSDNFLGRGHSGLSPDYDPEAPCIADLQAARNAKEYRLEITECRSTLP